MHRLVVYFVKRRVRNYEIRNPLGLTRINNTENKQSLKEIDKERDLATLSLYSRG